MSSGWTLGERRSSQERKKKTAKGCCQYSIWKEAFDILIIAADVERSKKLFQLCKVGGNKHDSQESWKVRGGQSFSSWQGLN